MRRRTQWQFRRPAETQGQFRNIRRKEDVQEVSLGDVHRVSLEDVHRVNLEDVHGVSSEDVHKVSLEGIHVSLEI